MDGPPIELAKNGEKLWSIMGIGNLGLNSESQVQYRASQPQAEDHCGGVAPNEASKNEGCQASHYAFPRQKWPVRLVSPPSNGRVVAKLRWKPAQIDYLEQLAGSLAIFWAKSCKTMTLPWPRRSSWPFSHCPCFSTGPWPSLSGWRPLCSYLGWSRLWSTPARWAPFVAQEDTGCTARACKRVVISSWSAPSSLRSWTETCCETSKRGKLQTSVAGGWEPKLGEFE